MSESSEITESSDSVKETEVKVSINSENIRPIVADYSSGSSSDSDSIDSEADSESESSDSSSSSDTDESDFLFGENDIKADDDKDDDCNIYSKLPPVEKLTISVPQDDCKEVGHVMSIVDTTVVVSVYKNFPPFDLDTVLFLDKGKVPLGRIFDIFGPVSEPNYVIRFNSKEEIEELKVEKGMKVYYAPNSEYTNFVFVSDLMKMKGSDASWKNNQEVPPECQDFSDDEEEKIFKDKNKKNDTASSDNTERKMHYQNRNFNRSPRTIQTSPGLNQPTFRHPIPNQWQGPVPPSPFIAPPLPLPPPPPPPPPLPANQWYPGAVHHNPFRLVPLRPNPYHVQPVPPNPFRLEGVRPYPVAPVPMMGYPPSYRMPVPSPSPPPPPPGV